MDHTILSEIHELNFAYLTLAQRLLADNKATGMVKLKIDSDTADLLAGLSGPQLIKLARINQLICHFAHHSADELKKLTSNTNSKLSSFHASLLLASTGTAAHV